MSYLEDLKKLNKMLLVEMPEYRESSRQFKVTEEDQFNLFRALSNVRMPGKLSEDFYDLEKKVLEEKKRQEGVVDVDTLIPVKKNDKLYIWQGDITRLNSDAIVNAANSQMLGCFIPLHNCIDNIIHTKAGIELREACDHLMRKQGHEEPVGTAKITEAFNLPSRFVIHTVGPQIIGELTKKDEKKLESSYRSVLELADGNNLKSVAFCCISTGVFRFPNDRAAEIAVATVEDFLGRHPDTSIEKVIFNVFKDTDLELYNQLLN